MPGVVLEPAPGRRGGAAYVVFGPFAAREEIDLAKLGARGFALRASPEGRGSLAGMSVAGAGDVNGDGLADVAVGAPGVAFPESTQRLTAPGHAYVVFGRRRPRDVRLGALGFTVTGLGSFFPDAFGFKVAAAGDVDHDGPADLAIDAPGNPGGERGGTDGAAYVLFGMRTGASVRASRLGSGACGSSARPSSPGSTRSPPRATGTATAAATWRSRPATPARARARSTSSTAAATRATSRSRGCGDGVLIRGGRSGPPSRFSGAGLAGGADVNGDRRPDLVAGLADDGPGRVWVVAGTRSPATIRMFPAGPQARVAAVGREREWDTGGSVALGRIDADARADVVLLANGTPYVVYGLRSGPAANLAALTPAQGFALDTSQEPVSPGSDVRGAKGFTTVAAGDVTGDGRAEILAGSNRATHLGRAQAGAAYLFFPS